MFIRQPESQCLSRKSGGQWRRPGREGAARGAGRRGGTFVYTLDQGLKLMNVHTRPKANIACHGLIAALDDKVNKMIDDPR